MAVDCYLIAVDCRLAATSTSRRSREASLCLLGERGGLCWAGEEGPVWYQLKDQPEGHERSAVNDWL